MVFAAPIFFLIDRPDSRARFLILGSASPGLLRPVLGEPRRAHRLPPPPRPGPRRGGARGLRPPLASGRLSPFLSRRRGEESFEWRRSFVQTFLERDLPQLGSRVPATTLHRFWSMRSALADLSLDRLDVIHAAEQSYRLADRVRAVAAARILTDVDPLR